MLSDVIEIPSNSEDDSLTLCRSVPTKQIKLEVAKVSVPPSDMIEISSDSEDESSCTQHHQSMKKVSEKVPHITTLTQLKSLMNDM